MYKNQQNSPSFEREIHTELVVAGGGVAGVCAAIAAARAGVDVVMIQNRPVLGGPSSTECHVGTGDCINGASEYVNREARETGIIEELKNKNTYRYVNGWRNHWSLTLRDMVKREKRIRLLMNTELLRAHANDGEIEYVEARGIGSELNYRIYAQYYIDATGDGTIGFTAGAEFRMGREGKDEFGESMAPDGPDAKTMGNSICFVAEDVGYPVKFTAPEWAYEINSDEDLPYRLHNNPQKGYWWLEYGGEIDTIADNEEIYETLRGVLLGMWNHVKNTPGHGAENYALKWIAPFAGKRESRRFMGDYILSEKDLRNQSEFPDAAAYGGWPVDIHPPEGVFGKSHPGGTPPFFFPGTYAIPFRSLYSKNISNLMMAGRDISVTHVALGTTRVMATCAVCGQATGLAVSLLKKYQCTPRALVKKHVEELRELFQKNDLTLPNRPIIIHDDLARSATVSASHSAPLSLRQADGAVCTITPQRNPDMYDPCDVPDEDRRIGQYLPLCKGKFDSVTLKFNNRTGERKIGLTLADASGHILGYATATIETGEGVYGIFHFDLYLKESGKYLLLLDIDQELEICTSQEYLPGVLRKLDGCYPYFDNFVFELSPPQHPYGPMNVINDYGRPAGNHPNMWIGDPAQPMPQKLTLSWQEKNEFSQVELIFDTNLDRPSYTKIPPECVKDYSLWAIDGDSRTLLAEVKNNHHRRNLHHFDPITAEHLEVVINSTNGSVSARIISLRVFR